MRSTAFRRAHADRAAATSRDWAAASSPKSSRVRATRSASGSAKSRDGPAQARRSLTSRTASRAMPAARRPAVRIHRDIASAGQQFPASSVWSSVPLLAEQFSADPAGADIDHEHREDQHQQDRADVRIVELADRRNQFHPDAAGADKTHHRGAAHIDLEAQQRVAGKTGRDLRQHREAHRGDPARAGGAQAFDRLHVDILDHFGVLLAERADRMDGERENAGHRTKTEGNDEDQREYDIRHGAAEFQQPLDDKAGPGTRRGIFSGQEIAGKAEHGARQRSDIAYQDGLTEQQRPFFPAPEPIRNTGPDPLSAIQREDAVEIADEMPKISEQRPQ